MTLRLMQLGHVFFVVGLVLTPRLALSETLILATSARGISAENPFDFSGAIGELWHRQVYQPLFEWTEDFQLKPILAESWESDDNRNITFYLRKGVRFHNGNQLEARDIVWSIKAAGQLYEWIDRQVGEIKIIDNFTLRVAPASGDARLWSALSYVRAVPHDSVVGEEHDLSRIAGTGPFVFHEFEPGVKIVLERSPNWWGEWTGNITRIEIISYGYDMQALIGYAQAGQIHLGAVENFGNAEDGDQILAAAIDLQRFSSNRDGVSVLPLGRGGTSSSQAFSGGFVTISNRVDTRTRTTRNPRYLDLTRLRID